MLPSLFSDGLFLKAENLQNTNSFKVRAAAGQILSLTEDQLHRGLVTSSSRNFGQAAAYVASLVGCGLQVVLTRRWGVEVIFLTITLVPGSPGLRKSNPPGEPAGSTLSTIPMRFWAMLLSASKWWNSTLKCGTLPC